MSIKKNQIDHTFEVRLQWTDNLGKRRSKNKKGFITLTLAKKWERDTSLQIETGEFDKFNENMTLNKALDMWFETYRTKVLASTYEKNRRFINKHVLSNDWFNEIPVNKITPVMLQHFLNDISTLIHNYKKDILPFKQTMTMAVSLELIPKNPFDTVTLPTPKPSPIFMDRSEYYTREQLELFMNTAHSLYAENNFKVFALFRVLAFSGMRRGEVLALEWSDIDYKNNIIKVNKSLVTHSGSGTNVNPPKTKAGFRDVKIDDNTLSILHALQAQQAKKLFSLGMSGSSIVFPNDELTGYLSVAKPRKWAEQIIKYSGLPRIKIHGFRHTYATLAVEAGMNTKQLQYQLGHDDIKTTLAVYSSVTQNMKDTTADVFTKLVNF